MLCVTWLTSEVAKRCLWMSCLLSFTIHHLFNGLPACMPVLPQNLMTPYNGLSCKSRVGSWSCPVELIILKGSAKLDMWVGPLTWHHTESKPCWQRTSTLQATGCCAFIVSCVGFCRCRQSADGWWLQPPLPAHPVSHPTLYIRAAGNRFCTPAVSAKGLCAACYSY